MSLDLSTLYLSESDYANAMPQFITELHRAFRNAFALNGEFRTEGAIPGERYGSISIDSYDFNADRPTLQNPVGGPHARLLQLTIATQMAFATPAAMGYAESLQYAQSVFCVEAIAFEHRFAQMKAEICGPAAAFIEDLILAEPIDARYAAPIDRNRQNQWFVYVTAAIDVPLIIATENRRIPTRQGAVQVSGFHRSLPEYH